MDDKQPHTFLLRGMAGLAGLLLALVSASALLAADRLLWALNAGGDFADKTQASVEHSLDASSATEQELVAAHAALTGAAYTIDHFLGNVISATKQFEWLVAFALLAGLVAGVVACLRRPREVWPEWVWAACAVFALLPAMVTGWWFLPGIPLGATIALAAVLHVLRRHDITVARGAAAVAPHAVRAVDRGAPVARKALGQGEAAGRKALEKGAPVAREALKRGKPSGPPWELPPQAPPGDGSPPAEPAGEAAWPSNPRPDATREP
jgi:hypothetical protein